MSLLFDFAISQFDVADAIHYSPAEAELASADERVPIRPIAEFARNHKALEYPGEKPYTCLPLHEPDSATLTGEYLAYDEDQLRGEIIIYLDGTGKRESIDVDQFAESYLAQRLRFWHSDYRPSTYPPAYDRPIDDREQPRNPTDPEAFVAGLEETVDAERRATRQANREQLDRLTPRDLYDRGGEAIPSLEYDGHRDGLDRFVVNLDTDLQSRRDDDWSYFVPDEFGIHQGNEVLLCGAGEGVALAATVENLSGLRMDLAIEWGEEHSVRAYRERFRAENLGLVQLLNPVPFERELTAIEQLADHPLLDVLAGQRPITFTNGAAARSEIHDEKLNQEQQLAAELALLADDVFCIHGPPGTGKTRTLVEIVRRAAAAGERVLVCADSNQAIDNIVVGDSTSDSTDERSLHAYGQHGTDEFDLRRVNAERSDHTSVQRWYSNPPANPSVVAATNNSVSKLHGREFDLLILDEATQATCTAATIPIVRANRVVLAGDHKQLPPFHATEEPPDSSFGLSLFEHLYADGGVFEGVGIQLKTQYRMHRDIARFSNKEFYARELRNGLDIDTLPEYETAMEGYNVGGRVEVHDHSRANPTEARLVVHVVDSLLDIVDPAEIGVITPYTAQVRLIRSELGECDADTAAITVDTIDSFQGSEREAILLSLVRSNGSGEIGFLGRPLDGPRRLNVALTRAKRYCGVIGDFHTLRYDAPGKCTDVYDRFYQHFVDTGKLRDVDPEFIPSP